jgi:hypothetical protein
MATTPEIYTWGGTIFNFESPTPEMVSIEDIAKSLSCICRYTGHCNGFYSVAQHSVLMANLSEFEGYGTTLQRLLHDSAEAYIGDIHRPLKDRLWYDEGHGKDGHRRRYIKRIRTIERRVQKVIGETLDVDLSDLSAVKPADNIMMATEVRDLLPPNARELFETHLEGWKPIDYPIEPWSWQASYELFINVYNELKSKEQENDPNTSQS